jgi:hypothetical protein
MRKHATRGYAASSGPRRSLAQSKVRAVFVMVRNILAQQLLQMAFIDRDNVIQQVAAAAADPALRYAIQTGDELKKSLRLGSRRVLRILR